jgi:preprotein translocase subunit SecE
VEQAMATNPLEFFQQVRNETAKVMVFVFTTAAAIFFLVVDFVIRTGMAGLLSFLR